MARRKVSRLLQSELHEALRAPAESISDDAITSLFSDLCFLCQQQGVPLPVLPVRGKDEVKVFLQLLLVELELFDDNIMAVKWIEHVNGVKIFPKLPHHLRRYHR